MTRPIFSKPSYQTNSPLVVFGATGLLASELIFLNFSLRFTPHVVLHSQSMERLQGLKDEIEEAGFGRDIKVEITTSVQEACDYGGYLFYARSTRAKAQLREEMLLVNAPLAVEVADAIKEKGAEHFKRVVCVSNPSDVIGWILLERSGLSPERVISLSALDTLRLRRSLCRRFPQITTSELEVAYTLGSHDAAMAPMLHGIRVGGKPISHYSSDLISTIRDEVRLGGISIYHRRGHTAYQSPAVLSLRMMMATDAEPFLLPVSRYFTSTLFPDVFWAFSSVVNSTGAWHCPYTPHEEDLPFLRKSYESIQRQKEAVAHILS